MLQGEGIEGVTHKRPCNGKKYHDHNLTSQTLLPLSHLKPCNKIEKLSAGMYASIEFMLAVLSTVPCKFFMAGNLFSNSWYIANFYALSEWLCSSLVIFSMHENM